MLYIYPYKTYSETAKKLRQELRQLGIRVKFVLPNGRFNPRRTDKVINWGNTTTPRWSFDTRVDKNPPEAVQIAANKLLTFNKLRENNISIPRFTTSREEAQAWLLDGSTILVRNLLNSHSGNGIRVVTEGQLPNAPLYVEYKKKRYEYRVHVFNGEVIDTCVKKKRNLNSRPDSFNTFIRSHNNGWVFCRDSITPDPSRDSIAIQAVQALGLHFGAVDLIYNERERQYYILEVNTAPGLEGTTLQRYIRAITT